MQNEDQVLTPSNSDDVEAGDVQEDTQEPSKADDSTDWQAEATKWQRIAKQRAKKLKESSPGEPKEPSKETQELGYAEKAYLTALGFKGADEFKVFEDTMKVSGKSLEDLAEDGYVNSTIKGIREAKAAEEATPSTQGKGGQSPRSDVDYWIQKGELPPEDQVELRRKVVNARIAAAKNKKKFGG